MFKQTKINYPGSIIFVCLSSTMKKQHLFLILFYLLFSTSCKNSKSTEGQLNEGQNDSLGFIKLPDTSAIDPSWSKKNVVVVHSISEPDNLHPTNGTSALRAEIFYYTQMMLVQTDMHHPGLRPALCKELPTISADGLHYSFTLREEPNWDDKSPLTADDIVFTTKANKCSFVQNPSAKPYWMNIKDIVIDPANSKKFMVVMKTPYIQNIAFWSDFPIMERKFYDPSNILKNFNYNDLDDNTSIVATNKQLLLWSVAFNDQKYGFDPAFLNGLGMYRVEKWEPGQTIILTKKTSHWAAKSENVFEKALPDKIIYKINKDATSTMLDFKSQAMDASTYTSAKTLLDLKSDPNFNKNYTSRFLDSYGYTYIAMNMRSDGISHKRLFDDVRIRRAMALLAPIDDLIRIVNKGINKRITGPVSYLKPEYNALPLIPMNIQKAKQLLDEAGWKDIDGDNIREKNIDGKMVKFEFDFNYLNTQVEWKDMADIICEGMMAGGVKAIAVPYDPSVFFTKGRQHDYDMMMGSLGSNSLLEDYTQAWHTSSWANNGSNFSGFGNSTSDSLIDKIKVTLDINKSIPMIKQLQQIIYDEQPFIFLYASVRRIIVHKRWGNQEMYYDRPGLLYNNLKLLSGVSAKDEVNN